MSEALQISQQIQKKINELDFLLNRLRETAEAKAKSEGEYDKVLAVTVMGLQNGKEYSLGGDTIKEPPVSIIDKVAKGICWKEKMEATRQEGLYRGLLSKIDGVKAQLNAYQSIFRHLEEIN